MPNRWPHDTHEKLELAGYRMDKGPAGEYPDGVRQCKYPPCEQKVIFYITPNGKEMPFQDVTEATCPECKDSHPEGTIFLQPHAATCEGYKKREADRKAAKAVQS